MEMTVSEAIKKLQLLKGGDTEMDTAIETVIHAAKYSINDELVGQTFGRLTVIEKSLDGIKNGSKTRTALVCLCECGKTKTIKKDHLKGGNTQSCGCLQKENGKKMGSINIHYAHNSEHKNEITEETREKMRENGRKLGLSRRKHFGCTYCGSDKHYAKGLCRSCYDKAAKGTLYK